MYFKYQDTCSADSYSIVYDIIRIVNNDALLWRLNNCRLASLSYNRQVGIRKLSLCSPKTYGKNDTSDSRSLLLHFNAVCTSYTCGGVGVCVCVCVVLQGEQFKISH